MAEIAKQPKVYDLDVLKPDPVIVTIIGESINVGFIPFGVAMKVEKLQNQLTALNGGRSRAELADDESYGAASLDITSEIVLLIAKEQAPGLTRERLEAEATLGQLEELITLTFRHMYGPVSAQRFDAALAAEAADEQAGKDSDNGAATVAPKKGGAQSVIESGAMGSPSSAASTAGPPRSTSIKK